MPKDFLFTSESVTEGHPDKVADQISDGVLDAILSKDIRGRVAVETLVKTGLCVVAGEVSTTAYVEIPKIVRSTIVRIGYTDSTMGFDGHTCGVMVAIEGQSQDIARGVDNNKEQGAGDQGMMFGYACNETAELMPAPIHYAHALTRRLAEVRRKLHPWLRPDGKSQVTVQYEDGRPVRIDTVVVSTQHAEDATNKKIHAAVMEDVIAKALPRRLLDRKTRYHINPTGRFVIGGPMGDSGVTGRKIIVDTYGGMGRHGGGAFSGKDPSKVDRSAAYMGRYIAKNVVGRRTGRPLRGAGVLRHRRGRPGVGDGGHLRDGAGGRGADCPGGAAHLRAEAARDCPASGFAAPHLPAHGGLRALRPPGEGLHLGTHRHEGCAARGCRRTAPARGGRLARPPPGPARRR